jgi:hypothetical protein
MPTAPHHLYLWAFPKRLASPNFFEKFNSTYQMKKLFFPVMAFFALTAACNQTPAETPATDTDTTEVSTTYQIFGDTTITAENVMDADAVLALLEENDSAQVKVSGVIAECCQTKGCWMELTLDNEKTMLVRFKDYEFFVPMNSAGKTSIVEGIAKRQVLDVEWLRHQAEDAGKSAEEIAAITEPETRLTFTATGVMIE